MIRLLETEHGIGISAKCSDVGNHPLSAQQDVFGFRIGRQTYYIHTQYRSNSSYILTDTLATQLLCSVSVMCPDIVNRHRRRLGPTITQNQTPLIQVQCP